MSECENCSFLIFSTVGSSQNSRLQQNNKGHCTGGSDRGRYNQKKVSPRVSCTWGVFCTNTILTGKTLCSCTTFWIGKILDNTVNGDNQNKRVGFLFYIVCHGDTSWYDTWSLVGLKILLIDEEPTEQENKILESEYFIVLLALQQLGYFGE